jgi:hypothetical protein
MPVPINVVLPVPRCGVALAGRSRARRHLALDRTRGGMGGNSTCARMISDRVHTWRLIPRPSGLADPRAIFSAGPSLEPVPGIPTPAGVGDLAGAHSPPVRCLAFHCANRLRSSVFAWLDRARGMLLP